jgi:kynurenine formamidase
MSNRRPTQDQLLQWMRKDLSNWGRWGKDDQLGTLNYLSAAKTKKAVALVQEGVTVSCARQVEFKAAPDVPRPPQHFMVGAGDAYRPGETHHPRQVAMDYFGLVFHGHTVTHVDSLCHFFWDGKTYNGYPSTVVNVAEGATKLDVDPAHRGIVTRGVLVDAAWMRGVEYIRRGDGVGMGDIEKAESECGFKVEPGDVLLMRTGQLGMREKLGPVDTAKAGSAGPLPEILPFMYERGVAVMGSDTGNDVTPSGYPLFSNPVHQVGIVAMGLWILDNAWLDTLAEECRRRKRWHFLITINPLRLPTVTGSPVNPIAVF